jgi:hypothetical protein
MTWFYIGEKKTGDAHMTYKVVHEFSKAREVGNPMAGPPMRIEIMPAMTLDMETDDQDEARRRVNYLNGGGSLKFADA